jgi:hypothetical protein
VNSAHFAITEFYEVCLSTRNASATLKIPLGEIRSWGRLALRRYLIVPPENNVVGERSESMRIPTWLLVLLMGAGIILVVWLMINVVIY